MNIRRATGENWVSLDEWAKFRGSSLEAEAHRASRGHYLTRQFPSEKHKGKTATFIAVHRLDRAVQQEYNRWLSRLGPQGAERALAEIERGFDAEAARQARERYEAVQAYLAIKPRWALIEGRRVPSPMVIALCQARGIEQRTLRRWAEAFQSALDEARTPEAIYRAFQVLVPRKGGKVLHADDKRLKLRPEEMMLVQGLWLKRTRPDMGAVFEQLTAECIRCHQDAMAPLHRGFQGRYRAHRCANSECGFTLSYSTVRAAIQKVPGSAEGLARIGRKLYEDRFARHARRDWSGVGRNEVVYGDHHQLDAACWDPARPFLRDGRTPWIFYPWLSTWQDVATGVVAWRLGVNPNAELLSLAFRSYILTFGVPATAWSDNGEDYLSERFKTLCQRLGVELHQTQPSQRETGVSHARSKPIERWFGTLERDLVRQLPGWRGSNTTEREQMRDLEARLGREHAEFLERGPRSFGGKPTPLLTFDEMRERLEAYTEQHYYALPPARQNLAPLDAFLADSRPVHTISDERVLDLLLMEAGGKQRVVGRNGVSLFDRDYWSPRFALLKGQPCRALWDPADVGQIVALVERPDGQGTECIVAHYKPLAGFSEQDIKRERELARGERRTVQEYIQVRNRAAAGVKPLDQVWMEKQALAGRRQPAVAAVAGGVPLVTEGHRIARALENQVPGSRFQVPERRPEKPRLVTFSDETDAERDKPAPLRRFEDE